MLRPYQSGAHDAVINHIRKSTDTCMIDAVTSSGKSWIISAIAKTIHKASGKRILCTAPTAELVEQNNEKYLLSGGKASMFSSSVGEISLRHHVIFGTPKTVLNRISRFRQEFSGVIIDECDAITPTIKQICYYLKQNNHHLRIIGTTGTPYRFGTGYIYEIDVDGRITEGVEPYFKKLLRNKWITPAKIIQPGEHYNTSHLELNSLHKFKNEDKAYEGQGRKTSRIIADIVEKSKGKRGVLIYAATERHAIECMQSLPPEMSAMVTAKTKKNDRKRIIEDFKKQKLKYIVNIGVLAVGFDAPHVDVIALLRLTESARLLMQICGRGFRIFPGKEYFLLLDYAENLTRHCPDGNIYNPEIKTLSPKEKKKEIKAECESCGNINDFSARGNKDGFQIDKNGYFVDLRGNRIETDVGPVPAHYGRRCMFYVGKNRCNYRWTSKKCEKCGEDNDIAAKYCIKCKSELVNPNDKLLMFERKENVLHKVINITESKTKTKKGSDAIRVNFLTDKGAFNVWFQPNHSYLKYQFFKYKQAKDKGIKGVMFVENNGFYKVDKYLLQ